MLTSKFPEGKNENAILNILTRDNWPMQPNIPDWQECSNADLKIKEQIIIELKWHGSVRVSGIIGK